jgi:hypothetical protein
VKEEEREAASHLGEELAGSLHHAQVCHKDKGVVRSAAK